MDLHGGHACGGTIDGASVTDGYVRATGLTVKAFQSNFAADLDDALRFVPILDARGEIANLEYSSETFEILVQFVGQREHTFMNGACVVCQMPERVALSDNAVLLAKAVPCPGLKPVSTGRIKYRTTPDAMTGVTVGDSNPVLSDVQILCDACERAWESDFTVTRTIGNGVSRFFCAECGKIGTAGNAFVFQNRRLKQNFERIVQLAAGELP